MVSSFFYHLHQGVMTIPKIPWPPILASIPPLKLPYTIHHHQHIHRMKERLAGVKRSLGCNFAVLYHFFLLHLDPFFILLIFFLSISSMGLLALQNLKIRSSHEKPKNIDMFFTAVSAATVSSMSTVEIEAFSNPQLIVLTILMLLGGEIFISLLGLQFKRLRLRHNSSMIDHVRVDSEHPTGDIELQSDTVVVPVVSDRIQSDTQARNNAIPSLSYVVLGYLLVIHIGGTTAIMAYIYTVPNARRILREKGLNNLTFSLFTTVSSFSNCGFIPTNENMVVFKKNLGLLLLIIPQSLLGGTMYPVALRCTLWFVKKITKRKEFEYILGDGVKLGYDHLFPWLHSLMLTFTVLGFLVVQFVAICAMEWSKEVLKGLSAYEKVVNCLFLAVNSRHTGESTVDLSTMTAAILVLFVFMMYLPPYTTFMPFKDGERRARDEFSKQESMSLSRSSLFSQLSFLAIFVMIICITERDKFSQDPLNFNIFSITFEVVSAYGNVGYSIGYSCSRRLTTNGACQDRWTGFAGRWSTSGKVLLIVVMFYGRLKRYTMRCGNAWKLSCKK